MKFGKDFTTHLEETLPEWREKFLCYKPLKKLLKNLPPPITPQQHPLVPGGGGADHYGVRNSVDLQEWFVRILNEELDKFNDFFVDKEEEFVIRFQELKERIQLLKEKSNRHGFSTLESEFGEEMMDIRKDLVMIHGEMVLLKTYSSLNLAGVVKILKKYDKRTGDLLRLPFTQLAVNQPFCTTDSLTRLVRECEANLELLFPLEAEVVESTNPTENQLAPPPNNNMARTSTGSQTPSNLGAETVEIYRGTLAAMKAIRGLQKASSTYGPLSFSSIFRSHEGESAGTVTAENSAADSPSVNRDEADEDDAHSV